MEFEIVVFLLGVGITLAACLFVVAYLKTPLERVLEDLCGTHDRAKFWTVFSNIALVLTPLIFAMSYQPDLRFGRPPIFELSNQLRLVFGGQVATLLVVGFMISRFIPPPQFARRSTKSTDVPKPQAEPAPQASAGSAEVT